MKTKITKEQVENIQLDHGIMFKNYGLETQALLAPLRGGTTFTVERTYRNIEFDGARGKTKGLTTLDDENATLTAKTLNASLETFADKLPGAKITITNAMDENGLEFAAVQKAEGEVELAYSAHHVYDENEKVPLYTIENIKEISYEAQTTQENTENQEEEV